MKTCKIGILVLTILALSLGCKKSTGVLNNSVDPTNFLSNDKYTKLVVEILYVEGSQPTDAAVDHLKNLLSQRLNKSSGIDIVRTPIKSPGKAIYTIDDIKAIEEDHRTQNTHRKILTACFFFADADFSGNTSSNKVLGIAYGNSAAVIFESTIKQYSGGLNQPSAAVLEATVIEHEFGHILGLVDYSTPMQTPHRDVPNGRHCTDNSCLMYYTAETSDIIGNLLGGSVPSLDVQCVNDLKANGGK
jgi:predicted Zn-dependent protease